MKEGRHYFDKVYELVRQIPFGKVCTYGILADHLTLGSARMVGWALHQSGALLTQVPAHRVVNRKGELSGRLHFPSPSWMEEMLHQEGIPVVDHRVQDLEKYLWRPESETS